MRNITDSNNTCSYDHKTCGIVKYVAQVVRLHFFKLKGLITLQLFYT